MGLVFTVMDTSMVFGAAQNPVYNRGSASRVVVTGIGVHIPRARVIAPSTRDTRTRDVRADSRDNHSARTPLIIYWILGGTKDH